MIKVFGFILLIFILVIMFVSPMRNYMNNVLEKDKNKLKEEQIIGTVSGYNPRLKEITKPHTEIDTFLEQESALTVEDAHLKVVKDDLTKKDHVHDEVLSFRLKSKDRVKQIQSALRESNFYKGEIDGKIGPQTKRAIKAFQKSKGLNPDGVVGSKTWEELNKYLSQ